MVGIYSYDVIYTRHKHGRSERLETKWCREANSISDTSLFSTINDTEKQACFFQDDMLFF